MNIGKLTDANADGGKKFTGYIRTIDLDIQFWLEENDGSINPKAPTHLIMMKSKSGYPAQIGAAWLRKAETEANYGKEFFSLSFDDPSFPTALNVAAFKNEMETHWDITFRRRQKTA